MTKINSYTVLEKLRQETDALHQRLEEDNPAQTILNHTMNLDGYKSLLLQNYLAYQCMEEQIKTFLPQLSMDKTQRLEADLTDLGISPEVHVQYHSNPFKITSVAQAFGAAYVVEGSAMGGMVIAKHLRRCQALKDLKQQHFFNGDKSSLASWKFFQEELLSQDFDSQQEKELLEAAKDAFLVFEKFFQVSYS